LKVDKDVANEILLEIFKKVTPWLGFHYTKCCNL
jgi:hypothetical protein